MDFRYSSSRNISLAGRFALMDVVIQTRALLPNIPGQLPVAASHMVKPADQLNGILHRSCAGVGTEISRLVLGHPAGQQHPG